MISLDNTIISDDLEDVCFVCDIKKCKGACCVEGDAGAPLDAEEISILENEIEVIKPYMTAEGIAVVEQTGVFVLDDWGNMVTPLVNHRECVYVYFENEIALCAIEKAWEHKKLKFQKPISCHLYPVRIHHYNDFDAVNYHRWHICEKALVNGKRLNIKVYEFLKQPLIRKYGQKWYKNLENCWKKP
ncbi:MAG: DUF3109 family protein [Bacteroidetes bacterium]|nr:DUF3109 family protein [Bacteroidota bacterium]